MEWWSTAERGEDMTWEGCERERDRDQPWEGAELLKQAQQQLTCCLWDLRLV